MKIKWLPYFGTFSSSPTHVTFLKQMKSFVSGILPEIQGNLILLVMGSDVMRCCDLQSKQQCCFWEHSLGRDPARFSDPLQTISEKVALVFNFAHWEGHRQSGICLIVPNDEMFLSNR